MESQHHESFPTDPGIHWVDAQVAINELFELDCSFAEDNDEIVAFENPEQLHTFLLGEHKSSVYVINNEVGKAAGYIALVPEVASLEVLSIGIRPEMQGKGYGKELMQQAEQIAGSAGKSAIHLVTKTSNAAAITFYEKLGYRQTEVIANHYAHYDNAPRVRMEKSLAPPKS
jgi:ribosomal protein S18 acetylase RimI-like enzyme